VSGRDQLVETQHLFAVKGKRGMTDDHLWLSVVTRPARSRFTRIQRLSCCLSLLFTAMLANAMFYGTVASSSANGLSLGPFSLSLEQVRRRNDTSCLASSNNNNNNNNYDI